ncbi:MAG: hypothetical protein J6M02_00240 [Clostridia bacterium]|nr:hypothetical protein [Clostridia bacterium]
MEYKDDENLEKENLKEETENKVTEETTVESAEKENGNGGENVSEQEIPKNNNLALSFVVTFLIIAVIVVFVIMTVVPLVSSKEKFFKISQNAGAEIGNMIENLGDSVFGKMLTIGPKEKFQATTDLELALETKDQELLDIIYGFKNLKLTLNQDFDLGNHYTASEAKVLINDEDFVSADVLEDDTYIALKSAGIADQYLRAEKNNLHSVWHRLNMEGPDQLGSQNEVFEKLQLTKAEKKEFENTFKRVFNAVKKLYTNADFTEGTEAIHYNNADRTLSYVDLKLTSKKMNDSVIAILEQLQKETKAIDILVAKLNGVGEVYEAMGYENTVWTQEEVLNMIEDMLEEIRDFEVSEEEGMLLRVYYSGWDLTPMGLAMFMLPTDEVYDFKYADGFNKLLADKEGGYYEYSDQIQEYVDVVSTNAKVDTHQFEIRYKNYTSGEVLSDYTEKYTFTVDYSNKNKLICNLKDPDGYIDYTLSGEINGKVQTLKLTMKDFYEEGETNDLNLTVTLNRNADVTRKELAAGEFLDLNNASEEEFNATIANVKAKWDAFVATNETKINQFSTIVGAYMTMLMPYDPYDYSGLMLEDAQG